MTEDAIDLAELKRRTKAKSDYDVTPRETIKAGEVGYRVSQGPLDRWHSKGVIDQRQYDAGCEFRSLYHASESVSGSRYDGSVAPDQYQSRTLPQTVIERSAEYRATAKFVGKTNLPALIGLCITDFEPELTARQKDKYIGAMRVILDMLADRWGY